MDKNTFLIYNDIVYGLYTCNSFEDLKKSFLAPLRMLIPFSYGSILLADESDNTEELRLTSPLCIPDSFTEAEEEYMRHADKDDLLWLVHSKEPTLIKESDLLPDESRLNSSLYLHCYRKYRIFDSLQYSIVYNQHFLGILTLFRTKIDGAFTEDDMFYLRSLCIHLNSTLNRINTGLSDTSKQDKKEHLQSLKEKYGLTARETEILGLIFEYRSTEEIASLLDIQENTIQKHMQNIFHKTGASSRWELLRWK